MGVLHITLFFGDVYHSHELPILSLMAMDYKKASNSFRCFYGSFKLAKASKLLYADYVDLNPLRQSTRF
jgi:hypothetical protein